MKGVYSSGGSTANLIALGAARQWALEQAGWTRRRRGLDGRRLAIYTSTQAHHTVQRSVAVLGIGREHVRPIPTDRLQRMDLAALEAALRADRDDGVLPVAVVAAAGTTNTGAIDPLRGAGELAHEFGAWFHVDGAYGLPGILDERVAPLYDGLELADSAIADPHKWLGAPVGIAATFVRDRAILHRAFTQEPADYLEGAFADDDVQVSLDSMGVPYFDFAVELSAPPRGVMVWAILREIGLEGLRQRVVDDNDFARQVATRAHAHPQPGGPGRAGPLDLRLPLPDLGDARLGRGQPPDPSTPGTGDADRGQLDGRGRLLRHPPLLHQRPNVGCRRRSLRRHRDPVRRRTRWRLA